MGGAHRTDRYQVPQDGKDLAVVLLASIQHHLQQQYAVCEQLKQLILCSLVEAVTKELGTHSGFCESS